MPKKDISRSNAVAIENFGFKDFLTVIPLEVL